MKETDGEIRSTDHVIGNVKLIIRKPEKGEENSVQRDRIFDENAVAMKLNMGWQHIGVSTTNLFCTS